MKLEAKIDIGLVDINKIGLLIWGTKSGYRTLLDNNIKSGQVLSLKQNFLEEVTSLYKEDLFAINPQKQGASSFAVKKFSTCKAYVKYINIYENNQQSNRTGFYSISIFISNQYTLQGENVITLLNKLDEIFSRNFLDASNSNKKYIKDTIITYDKFRSLIDTGVPLQTSYESIATSRVGPESYNYKNSSEVALIVDYLNAYNTPRFTYITQEGVNLLDYTKDTSDIIRSIKEKQATRQIDFQIYSKNTREFLEGSINIQYEGKNTLIKTREGASVKSLVIDKDISPITYEITNIVKAGFKIPLKDRTTLQQLQLKGNKLTIEVEEKPCFIFTVNYNNKPLSVSAYIFNVLGGKKSILKTGTIKVYPDNQNKEVGIEVIPNDKTLRIYKNKYRLTKPVERQEIAVVSKPIIQVNVIDGKWAPILDESSYELRINGSLFKGQYINLDDYDNEFIDFRWKSHFYGDSYKQFSKKELLGKVKIDIKFDKSRNFQNYKWIIKDKESGKNLEDVQYQIYLTNGFPAPSGTSDQNGVIAGEIGNKNNSDVKPEDIKITLTKTGYNYQEATISSFYGNLEMEAQKKKITILFKNDAAVLKKLKKVDYKHPKQTSLKSATIKDNKITIEFPFDYEPQKGDKLNINIGANEVNLKKKLIIIDLLKNKNSLFSNVPFEIALKEKSEISRKLIVAILSLFLVSAIGISVYLYRDVLYPNTKSGAIAEAENAPDKDKVFSDGGSGGRPSTEKTDAAAKEKIDGVAKEKTDAAAKEKTDVVAKEKTDAVAKEKTDAVAKEKIDVAAKKKADAAAKEKTDAAAKKKTNAPSKANTPAKRLIDKIEDEIKRKNFSTNIKRDIEGLEYTLVNDYNYTFDSPTNDKINAYKYTSRAVYNLNNLTDNKTEFEKSLSNIMTYLDCQYKQYYTREQVEFLENFKTEKMDFGVGKFDDFRPKSSCK